MWRKDHRRWFVVIGLGLAGCADAGRIALPSPIPSGPVKSVGSDGQPVPSFNSWEEVPSEYQRAVIYSTSSNVYWIDDSAFAQASTNYFGNRAQQEMQLTILRDYSTVATQNQAFLASHYLPLVRDQNSDFQFTTAESCGQTANLNVKHSAWLEYIVVPVGNATVYRATDEATRASAAQPDCTRDEDVTEPVGGGCSGGISCEDEAPAGYSWCVVRYSYDRDTGEILGWRILYCY